MKPKYGSGWHLSAPFWEQDSFLARLQYMFPYLDTPNDVDEPDITRPSGKFYDKETLCYRRLWLAVLEQAMEDLCVRIPVAYYISRDYTPEQKRNRIKQLRLQTEQWMRDEQSHGVGSFRYVCDTLDLDQQVMIERIFDGPGVVKPPIFEYFRTRKRMGRYVESNQMNKPHPKRTKKEIEDDKKAKRADKENPVDDPGGDVRACVVA